MTVAATLSLQDAARRPWDALVVGAGPAGSMAALGLSRRGLAVLLVDRAEFPRWKVCGCCLNGAALSALAAAGLGHLPDEWRAVPLTAMLLASRGQSARLPLGPGIVLSRTALDAGLVRAAIAAGAEFLPGTQARLGDVSEGRRNVGLETPGAARRASAKVVIAADGIGGRLLALHDADGAPPAARSRIGVGTVVENAPDFYGAGTIFMACGDSGYAGLVRLEDDRLEIAAALNPAAVRASRGPESIVERLLKEANWPTPIRSADVRWKGTHVLNWRARRVAAERVFAVGDATGYVEPFTGEGIALALTAGLAVVPMAAKAQIQWHDRLAREWTANYRRIVGPQLTCRAAAAVLRQPWLARWLIALLAKAPALARPVIRSLNTRVLVRP
jgi:flavin-dependent dehydrogenase